MDDDLVPIRRELAESHLPFYDDVESFRLLALVEEKRSPLDLATTGDL
jgi:hypothetical protein